MIVNPECKNHSLLETCVQALILEQYHTGFASQSQRQGFTSQDASETKNFDDNQGNFVQSPSETTSYCSTHSNPEDLHLVSSFYSIAKKFTECTMSCSLIELSVTDNSEQLRLAKYPRNKEGNDSA